MIIRPHRHWFVRLFAWHGSVLPGILVCPGLNLAMSLLAIFCLGWYESPGVKLTLAPFSLPGISIAIFLGFRKIAVAGCHPPGCAVPRNLTEKGSA